MPCLTCTHWKPREPNEEARGLAKLGYARCALGPSWRFLAFEWRCERFAELPAEQKAAREKWAKRFKE